VITQKNKNIALSLLRKQYLNLSASVAEESVTGKWRPQINGQFINPQWWINQKVKIYWEDGIKKDTIDIVVNAMRERFSEIFDSNFTFHYCGMENWVVKCLQASVQGNGSIKSLFHDKIFTDSYNDHCAKVVITQRPIYGDSISWGEAGFIRGLIVLHLQDNRQNNKSFLANVVAHETGHLLGFGAHCDSYPNVEGYRYNSMCNMHYACATDKMCSKCKDYMLQWWAQVLRERSV
jgi:hypothetical protein